MEKKALSVREFCAAYGVSRSTVYNLFMSGNSARSNSDRRR